MSQHRRFLKAITAIGLIIVAGCGAICATSQAAEPMVEYFKVSDGKLEPGSNMYSEGTISSRNHFFPFVVRRIASKAELYF